MSTVLNADKAQRDLAEYDERIATERFRFEAKAKWHRDLYLATNGNVELPWTPDNGYVNLLVSGYVYETREDGTTDYANGELVIDEDATRRKIAQVIQYARKCKLAVEKKYPAEDSDEDFEVVIFISDDPKIRITYYVNRKAVCKRVVVGTEVIPEHTVPEEVKEITEWKCEKLAFLGMDLGSED